MAKNGMRNGASYKAQYKKYAQNNTWLKNKIKRLEKTLKNQPDNKVAEEALARALDGNAVYNRNNNSSEHKCKGCNNILGFKNNKATIKTKFSRLWHTSTNYSKWFLPDAPKVQD